LNLILAFAILFSVFVVLFNSIVKWVKTIKTKNYIPDEAVPVTEGNEKI
jgi:hypothetical protein